MMTFEMHTLSFTGAIFTHHFSSNSPAIAEQYLSIALIAAEFDIFFLLPRVITLMRWDIAFYHKWRATQHEVLLPAGRSMTTSRMPPRERASSKMSNDGFSFLKETDEEFPARAIHAIWLEAVVRTPLIWHY